MQIDVPTTTFTYVGALFLSIAGRTITLAEAKALK
jgi:hypothetical protein